MTALPLNEVLMLLAALVAAGLAGGVIAGLFGVGGGTVIVPAVFYAFEVLGVGGEANLHVAIGTSLLTIVATSWRSLRAHRTHGAVDEAVLKTWTPWVAVGALLGAAVARRYRAKARLRTRRSSECASFAPQGATAVVSTAITTAPGTLT